MKDPRKTDLTGLSPADQPIPMRQQIAYAVSEIAVNPIYTITLTFLTFFYTDVLGLNAALVGAIILVSKVFDGISDLWAGNLIDHTHTKAGSARPWILRSAVLLAISYVILFTVPAGGNICKAIYIFVSYNFAMTIAYTITSCAINAMPVYMSNDSSSRASAYSIRMIVAGVVQMIFSMVCLNIVDAFRVAIFAVLKNKYWFLVFGVVMVIVFHQVATLTVGVYYAKYVLFDENLAGSLVTYHHLGAGVGMLAMPFILSNNISKKKIVIGSAWLMLAGAALALINSTGICLILSLALRGCGFGLTNSLYYGMLADSVDYGEYKTRIRAAAVTTSAGSVGLKLGSGLGAALLGFALWATGYDGLAVKQAATAVSCIRIIFIAVPFVLYIALLILMHFYDLDEMLPKIKEELAQRSQKEGTQQ